MPNSTDSDSTTRQGKIADSFYPKTTQESIIAEALKRVAAKEKKSVPSAVSHLEIRIRELTRCGLTWLAVDVWFNDNSDPAFAGARIWLKGYGTDNLLGSLYESDRTAGREDTIPFQLMTVVEKSPATLLLWPTDEELVIGVESVNLDGLGSGIDIMPTISFLSGV